MERTKKIDILLTTNGKKHHLKKKFKRKKIHKMDRKENIFRVGGGSKTFMIT